MPRIVNECRLGMQMGHHFDPTWQPTIWICISDPAQGLPKSPYVDHFVGVYAFEFLDLEDEDIKNMPDVEEAMISQRDADHLYLILEQAKAHGWDVIVNCTMGVARSGAVVEFAVTRMGFTDPETYRSPNERVLRMLDTAMEKCTGKTMP